VGEVIPAGEFYDYSAKYLEETARLVAPAEIPEAASERVRRQAVTAFKAIDGEGFARVDFFLPEDGEPVIIEINTLPGFTPISMFPRLWGLAGIAYGALITRIVELGIARHERNTRKQDRAARDGTAADAGVGS
jgi:D-alanine-D-alanine ligase